MSSCAVPGCGRSVRSWKNKGRFGPRPIVYQCHNQEVFAKWAAVVKPKCGEKKWKVCDIHFTLDDYVPTGYNLYGDTYGYPPHLRNVKKKNYAVPSLYLNERTNLFAQVKANKSNDLEWWKLIPLETDKSNETDSTVSKKNRNEAQNIDLVEALFTTDNVDVVDSIDDLGLSFINLIEDSNDLPANNSEVDAFVEYVNNDEAIQNLSPEAPQKNIDDEIITKKLKLFRRLCSTPIKFSSHLWAVHYHHENDYLLICQVSYANGFCIDRGIRLKPDMSQPDVHIGGRRVTLAEPTVLESVTDVEKLISEVNKMSPCPGTGLRSQPFSQACCGVAQTEGYFNIPCLTCNSLKFAKSKKQI